MSSMLPNADNAIIDAAKLREYCLNPRHPRGRHKARVFATALGLTPSDAEWLGERIREEVRIREAVPGESDDFGRRFVVDCVIVGPAGRATVRTAWIVVAGQEAPRLTSCYVV